MAANIFSEKRVKLTKWFLECSEYLLDSRCASLLTVCARHSSGNSDPNGRKTWIVHLQTTADCCWPISRAAHVQTLPSTSLSVTSVCMRREAYVHLSLLPVVSLTGCSPRLDTPKQWLDLTWTDKATKFQEKWQQTPEWGSKVWWACLFALFPDMFHKYVKWTTCLQVGLMNSEGFVLFCFHGSPLENSYFIGSYPDVFIIQKRLTGRGAVAGWAWAGQDTPGSPVTLPDCDKNKTLCDRGMRGLLPGKTENPTLRKKQQSCTQTPTSFHLLPPTPATMLASK